MAGDGPAPGRIVAAAASVSAGIGLVALLAGAGDTPEIVVQVEPTPVVIEAPPLTPVQPQSVPVPEPTRATPVQAASPAPQPTTPPRPVTVTEGS